MTKSKDMYYHCSDSKFEEFENVGNKMFIEEDVPTWFFTKDLEYAGTFGRYLYKVRLNVKKTFDLSTSEHMRIFEKGLIDLGYGEETIENIMDEQFSGDLPYWTCGDAFYIANSNGFDSIIVAEELDKDVQSIGVFDKDAIQIVSVEDTGVSEGLIKTIDTKSFVSKIEKYARVNTDRDRVSARCGFDVDFAKVFSIARVMGWFVSACELRGPGFENIKLDVLDDDRSLVTDISHNIDSRLKYDRARGERSYVLILFEQRHEPAEKNIPGKLFHVTDEKYLDKILSDGLEPRSQKKKSWHPERIYLTTMEGLREIGFKLLQYIKRPVLIQVDPADLTVHKDPNSPGENYFTTQNISPALIRIAPVKQQSRLRFYMNEAMTFSDECTGSHSGQSDYVLTATDGGKTLGYLQYSVYGGEPSVSYMEVGDKRKGVGTALLKELQKLYPDVEIDLGYTTEEGSHLVGSLKRKFVPDPKHAQLKAERDRLHARETLLLSNVERWREMNPGDDKEEVRDKAMKDGSDLDDITDRLFAIEVELQELRPGKYLIESNPAINRTMKHIVKFDSFVNEAAKTLDDNGYIKFYNSYMSFINKNIERVLAKEDELPSSYFKDGVEAKMDEITGKVKTLEDIKEVYDDLVKNFADLKDGWAGLKSSGRY